MMNKPLVTPFCLIVAASSNSGKTRLVVDLLTEHYIMFDHPVSEVVWCYHRNAFDDNLFSHLKTNMNVDVRFIEGFPETDLAAGNLFKANQSKLKCIVLDDIVPSAVKSPVFTDLFTVLSHHQNLIVIAILQNLHANTSTQRQLMNNIIRNVSYIALFPDRRQMNACKQIARTYFSGDEHRLVEPFKQLIENNNKYHYMLIDFIDPILTVRLNALRSESEKYTYVSVSDNPK